MVKGMGGTTTKSAKKKKKKIINNFKYLTYKYWIVLLIKNYLRRNNQ